MLVSDPSSPSIPLLPPASAPPGLIAGVGRMFLPLGMGEVSSAWMKKREFVTPTKTVATVAIKMGMSPECWGGLDLC